MSRESIEELEARLLASARAERASDAVREKTLARMLQERSESRRAWRPSAVAGVLAAAASVGLLAYVTRSPEAPISAERLSPRLAASSAANGVVSEPVVPLVPMPELPKVPETSASQRAQPDKLPKPVKASVAPLSLEEETSALQTVQAELRSGRAEAALAALERYELAAGNGRLAAEARLLKIQALAASGRSGEAAKLAERFVGAYPNSPLVDRAKKYLVSPGGGGNEVGGNATNADPGR